MKILNKIKFVKLEKFLTSPIIELISSNPISTSTIKYDYFYPVEKDGIGIFYIIVDSVFRAMLTSWQNNKKYLDYFVKNLEIVYWELLELAKIAKTQEK